MFFYKINNKVRLKTESNVVRYSNISALHISDSRWPPLWTLNYFMVQFNHVWSKQQLQATVCFLHFPLTFLGHLISERFQHGPHSFALGPAGSPGSHLRRKLFFIALQTQWFLPVWPSPPRGSFQVRTLSFSQLRGGRGSGLQEVRVRSGAMVVLLCRTTV